MNSYNFGEYLLLKDEKQVHLEEGSRKDQVSQGKYSMQKAFLCQRPAHRHTVAVDHREPQPFCQNSMLNALSSQAWNINRTQNW